MSPTFHLVVFVFGVIKRIRRQEKSKIPPLCKPSGRKSLLRHSSSYNKLLGKVTFSILSNNYDGALLGK